MSVEQVDVIDTIGVDEISGQVVLTISDHLEWGDDEHLLILQEKLNTYLSFVESGEIFETYPDAVGRLICINVFCKYPPDNSGTGFLNQTTSIVEGASMKFCYQISDEV